jgi:hypothetical protein
MRTSPSPSRNQRAGPGRATQWFWLVLLAALVILGLAACGGSNSTTTSARPRTNATLTVVSPTPNEVTGPNLLVQFKVAGAIVSAPGKNKLAPNEGHIHVSLDGRLVVMAYGTSTELNGLTPGLHTLQSEFVANDHLPFANRVIAVVLFTVK